MRKILSALILTAATAQAAPFTQYYGTYSVAHCEQRGETALMNLCSHAKTVKLIGSDAGTSLVVLKERRGKLSGAVGVFLRDGITNSAATYESKDGKDTLVDPFIARASLIKTVVATALPDQSVLIQFRQYSSGWPTADQNKEYSANILLSNKK